MPTQTPIQTPQKPNGQVIPFNQFIATSVDAEKVRRRREMLRGRKVSKTDSPSGHEKRTGSTIINRNYFILRFKSVNAWSKMELNKCSIWEERGNIY